MQLPECQLGVKADFCYLQSWKLSLYAVLGYDVPEIKIRTSKPSIEIVPADLFKKSLTHRLGRNDSVSGMQLLLLPTIPRRQNPKPFVWTKTRDEILETIARFCQRTSGPVH